MISISISCEQSELPALRAALAGVFGDAAALRNAAKARKEVTKEVASPPIHSPMDASIDTKEPRNSDKIATGNYPVNFYEAPIRLREPEPPEPGKNEYGRWDTPISAEIDAEIARLHKEGMPTRGISNELAKQGIDITWQRVRGRIAFMARQRVAMQKTAENVPNIRNVTDVVNTSDTSDTLPQDAPDSPVDEGKAPEVESPASKPEPKAMSRSELDRKIWDMHRDGMSAAEISESLYKEGLYYSEKSVQVRLNAQGAA